MSTMLVGLSQAMLKFTDGDYFTMILVSAVLMIIFFGLRDFDDKLLQCVIAFVFSVCTSAIWKRNKPPRERIPVNTKKTKEPAQTVTTENCKKKQKRARRSAKKSSSKENKEPSVFKKETKMFESWNTCQRFNRDHQSIYEHLHSHSLSLHQLRSNQYPHEGYHPKNEVDSRDSGRCCVRCGESFDICKGVYLSGTDCFFHPRKAVVSGNSNMRVHECCNGALGSPPCSTWSKHVTQQHQPRPLKKTSSKRYVGKDRQYRIFALDCEMSFTTDGLEVVRVCLVNLDGLPEYDFYVKPKNQVLDYNTMYSGVDKTHLQNVAITIDDAQSILGNFIHQDTILIGHALNNDLAALGLIHNKVVDTSVLYPGSCGQKQSLKHLASTYLGLNIQDSPSGHDCVDDARASLQLALLKLTTMDTRPVVESRPLAQRDAYHHVPLTEIKNFYNLNTTQYDLSKMGQFEMKIDRSGLYRRVYCRKECPEKGCNCRACIPKRGV